MTCVRAGVTCGLVKGACVYMYVHMLAYVMGRICNSNCVGARILGFTTLPCQPLHPQGVLSSLVYHFCAGFGFHDSLIIHTYTRMYVHVHVTHVCSLCAFYNVTAATVGL